MNNNEEMRCLDKSILEGVLKELNPEFIQGLPQSPEVLFKYAKRRVNPGISDNIDSNLGKKMLDTRLNDKDYFITFLKVIYDVFYGKSPIAEGTKPTAQVLLSQTGAGKTNLRKMLLQDFPNIVIINSDLYKQYRPDATEIMTEDPTHFGALTGIDCYDHASNVLDFATTMKYDILRECAPSKTGELVGVNMKKLNEEKYETKFHILAVGDIVSALAIHYRYEEDLINKVQGAKLTELSRHDESYAGLEEAVKKLNPETISIYKRGERNQFPVNILGYFSHKSKFELIEALQKQRDISNDLYIQLGFFDMDYEIIESRMSERNALEEQKRQLRMIKERCMLRDKRKNR